MSDELNTAARRESEQSLDGWIMTSGTPPGRKTGTMLTIVDKRGRPYAIGVGATDLEAANALSSDIDRRARQWFKIRKLVRTWQRHLRQDSADRRAERSAAFLASRKRNP